MIWCSLKFRCQLYTQLIFCWSVRWRPRSLRGGWWVRWTPSSSARRTTGPPPSPERGSQAGSRGPPGMGSCQSYYKRIENLKWCWALSFTSLIALPRMYFQQSDSRIIWSRSPVADNSISNGRAPLANWQMGDREIDCSFKKIVRNYFSLAESVASSANCARWFHHFLEV